MSKLDEAWEASDRMNSTNKLDRILEFYLEGIASSRVQPETIGDLKQAIEAYIAEQRREAVDEYVENVARHARGERLDHLSKKGNRMIEYTKYALAQLHCMECGAIVRELSEKLHTQWHEQLSKKVK